MQSSQLNTQELETDVAQEVLPPADVVDFDDFVDQIREEVGRHLDSSTNRKLIVELFREELDKEYFAQRVGRIAQRHHKLQRANQLDRVLWLVAGAVIAAIATRFIEL